MNTKCLRLFALMAGCLNQGLWPQKPNQAPLDQMSSPVLKIAYEHEKVTTELPKPVEKSRKGPFQNFADQLAEEQKRLDAKKKEAEPAQPKTPTKTIRTVTVTITPTTATREDEHELVHYDFLKRRIITVDKAKQTYQDDSMVAEVAFRMDELSNRAVRASALPANGSSMSQAEDWEAIFGIAYYKRMATFSIDNDNTTAEIRDRMRVAWSKKIADVHLSFSRSWALYLRYNFPIHPTILARIIELDEVPGSLSFHVIANFERVEHRIIFKSAKTANEPPFALPKELKPDSIEPEVSALWMKVKHDKEAGRIPSASEIEKQIDELIAQCKFFDAFLGLNALMLSFDHVAGESIERMTGACHADPRVLELQRTMNENVVKKLEAWNRDGLRFGYVLDVRIARSKKLSKNFAGARASYLAALKVNPYLASVYYDLGTIDIGDHQYRRALHHWDTLRLLAPKHSLLKAIERFEAETLSHREFFLTQAPEPR